MRKKFLTLSILMLVLAFCTCSYAAEFPVTDADGLRTALTTAESNGEDDTITLSEGTYLTGGVTFTYSAGSPDEGSLTITGTGEVILDGGGSDRVLEINSDYMTDITLQNLTVQNGNLSDDGAGAYINIDAGNINVVECSFRDNYVGDNYGGGLYAYISSSGNIDLTNCDFNGNYAYYYGGGVYAYISETGDITLQGNTFTLNSADQYGGAAYVEAYVGDIDVIGNTFTSNDVASYYGGALYIYQDYSGTITLDDNFFNGNTAVSDGGALYLNPYCGNTVNCLNNTFENNHSDSDGGAFYLDGDYNTNAYLFNNSFSGNTCGSDGGGAFLEMEYGDLLTMVSNDFYQNIADSYGGGAYLYVYDDGSSFTVDNCSFRENESYSDGGGLCYTDGGYRAAETITLTNSLFQNNRSTDGYGGGAYLYLSYGGAHCLVSGNEFSSNDSYGDGGGLYTYVYEGNLYVGNNTFDQNVVSSDYYGGGAYLECEYGDMTVENCSFTNNSCGYNGGGVYIYPYYGDFIFRNNLVAGNTSIYEGGGAYFYPEYVRYADIVNNTVTGNTVSEEGYYGGGMYIYCGDDNTVYSLYNNIIWNNSASDGNDIYLYDNSYLNYFYVYDNDFSVLSTDFSGGESYLYEDSNVDVDPMFVSTADSHLQAGSPVIDDGNSLAPSLPEIDLDGNARVYGRAVDMGAYEYGSSPVGDNDDDDDDITTSTSGSGGGCNSMSLVPFSLLLITPLALLLKK